MIDIAQLLQDAPKGMKLYSPLFGEVKFVKIDEQSGYPIDVIDCKGNGKSFTKFGVYFADHPDAECLLFPSKDCRTWEGWKSPVKPNLKVGDWIVDNEGVFKITQYEDEHGYDLTDTTGCVVHFVSPDYVETKFHLWTIQDAKDGDVLVDEYTNTIGIFEKTNGIYWNSKIYCGNSISAKVYQHGGSHHIKFAKPATKEQHHLLFSKIREAGYEWDADKKELKKILKHYDISSFYAGMPVLVRDDDSDEWNYLFFSHYRKKSSDHFFAGGNPWFQCIPFGEDTKHLLGTTDMCPEEYINW